IMEHVIDTGINFISLDAPSSLRKFVEHSNGKLTIMGNVPTTLFATGTREEMEKAITDCIETAAEGSGYILSSGCEIPLNSTEDRVEHFFRYAHDSSRRFMSRLRDKV
ncbi:MAG: uroporphyrinogen decarboxylase family protein, partial [Desulfobacteraceae bacterium]|nr:uroporphyrinogen decarboxylase family protein [Desulfobacteraceae bacterium]